MVEIEIIVDNSMNETSDSQGKHNNDHHVQLGLYASCNLNFKGV